MTKLMPWVGGKAQLMWAIQMLLPTHYKTLVDVFGGSGIITMNTSVPSGCLQIYNDLNHDLYNLLFCAKERPLELVRELGFLPINAHDEFDVLQRQLQGEDFTMEYMERQLDLTEVFFEPPQGEVVRQLLLERGSLGNVRRAAAFYKLQRYSYNGSGDSYGVGSCDIRRFFRDLWECSHRLKDAVLENKDFESIITARNDPQTVVYCDPPYYEAECYTVEFPRSDHQRLHDVLVKHTGFAMVSYNNCPYIRELYDDFFIYEVERPNSQSKKKNNKYHEYIMTNYDPRTFAPQMSFFGDYDSRGKSCRLVHTPQRPLKVWEDLRMNNEMKFEKNGLLIPNGALEELGLAGISLSAWLGQDHILLMPQEMTAEQLLHALDGLSQASVELLGVLQEACRMPCAGDCERDMDDVPQVPENIRPLLMLSGCCPSALAQLLEEGDIVYAAE